MVATKPVSATHNDRSLDEFDPELAKAIQLEQRRQEEHIELIASENYASPAVMAAQGGQMTNKYAEGYPGRRYYGGCEHVDAIEELAIERAKELFGAAWANVQPHSGAQANFAVFLALLQPGDTILGMSLAHGGHLTHGHPVNFSGLLFDAVHYEVSPDTETIDYDRLREQALAERPKMIIGGASAYPRFWDYEKLRTVADEVEAVLLFDMAHVAGLVAGGVHPSPVPWCDVVTSTTHKTLRGPRGGMILADAEHERALNSAVFPGLQGGPLMHVIAAKAVAFGEAMRPEFRAYQQQTLDNARAMVRVLAARGLRIVSERTDCHMFLVDLRSKNLTGREAEDALGRVGITVNKNAVPNDPQSPFVTSGIRIGTPAITTRGFRETEARELAGWICDILDDIGNPAVIEAVRGKVLALCKRFPVYGH